MPLLHSRQRRCERFAHNSAARSILNGYRPLVMLTGSQSRYVGQWSDNQKSGFGRETFRNGHFYEGQFRSQQRNGFGSLCRPLPNGDSERIYVGQWLNGKRHGDGKQFYRHGTYWGKWSAGVRCGLGIMWLNDNNSTYVGEWRDDKYDGAGVLFQANKNRYEGFFRHGLKHGEGTIYHMHTGQVQKGVWIDDRCVTSIMQDEQRNRVIRPTWFPIPKILLSSPDDVVGESFRECMKLVRGLTESTQLMPRTTSSKSQTDIVNSEIGK